ncbi:MAG: hypothetical protein KDA91_01105 [Planctomycetaceae bacterium]|nr:hypothetical protein [Planctomycetaceae bacterium]
MRFGTTDDTGNVFERLDGEPGYEVLDSVHHILHDISDAGVKTWLEEFIPEELAELEKLLLVARESGYDDDSRSLNMNKHLVTKIQCRVPIQLSLSV